MVKNLTYIAILILYIGCKSTKTTTNNQLDLSKEVVEKKENTIRVNQLTLDEFEITFHTANPKEEVIITDEKGNTKKFKNIKKATLKKKTEQKKDSVISEKKAVSKKLVDKSKIKETGESISDAVQYKWIGISLAVIVFCIAVIWLVRKLKK